MVTEAGFLAALLDPGQPVPDGLTDPTGRPAGRRFAVYRNTLTMGLRGALAEGFPILRELVGATFFDAMADVFLHRHPPQSRLLWQYGDAMPGFLQGFAPVSHLPYLACVARLELALRHSYHAADAPAMTPAELAAIPPGRFLLARLRLAPAVLLLRSDWPIHGIWQAHRAGAPPPAMEAEDVLVMRPGHDPAPHLLPPGGAAFVATLLEGRTVAAAMDAGGPGHAIDATLALMMVGGAIVALSEDAA